ncbi:uncharacterized protein LOC143038009 [Oratosquilla oratoria]|uniref:uncharacterized protein LOC143038009 n=1 Tax=Oratosquilla oratoria TaxID=337810 RepID=UPI003F76D2B5
MSTATTDSGGETLVADGRSSRSVSTISLDAILNQYPPDGQDTACQMLVDTSLSHPTSSSRVEVVDHPLSPFNNISLLTSDHFKEVLSDPLPSQDAGSNCHPPFGDDENAKTGYLTSNPEGHSPCKTNASRVEPWLCTVDQGAIPGQAWTSSRKELQDAKVSIRTTKL